MVGISTFFHALGDLILIYSSRRFRVHRVIQRSELTIARSLVIESVKRKRFLEVSYDVTLPYEQYTGVDPNKLHQTVDLSDILAALSRLRFDVIFYRGIWTSQGGGSMNEAIDKASARRRPFEERFHQTRASYGDGLDATAAFGSYASVEAFHKDNRHPFEASVSLSSDDGADSEDEMIRRLSNEVSTMGKKRQVLWKTVTCSDDGLEHQVLALE